jgi:flagellar hook-associated protein FlgK
MFDILNTAKTGLRTSQIQVDNTSNNLANETTEGYIKRTVETSEISSTSNSIVGNGVFANDVKRITNVYMYQNLISESSSLDDLKSLDSMLYDIESIFKETDTSGFSADLNEYFNSIEDLRADPNNEIYKNNLSSAGKVLVSDLQGLYSDVEKKEKYILQDTNNTLDEVNNILNNIGDINKQISNATTTPNDLYDKRDALELELAKYADVEISRDEPYQLKLGGVTAVRFDTNVRQIKLKENYIPQRDTYTKVDENGNSVLPYESNIIDKSTWNGDGATSEVQTLRISGSATSQVNFLGATVANADGSDGHKTPKEIRDDIVDDKDNIIATWNKAHPYKEIENIEAGDSDEELKITYKDTEGDVEYLPSAVSSGITFGQSVEATKGYADSVSFIYNNDIEIKVSYGDVIVDDAGNAVDLDGDGDNTNDSVTEDNIIKALVYKINQSKDIGGTIKAYNGQYEIAPDGSKILTNDPRHSLYDANDPNKDRYLVVESTIPGEKGQFTGEILVHDDNGDTPKSVKQYINKNPNTSIKATDDIHLEAYDEQINLSSGSLKSMINNLKTDSGANLFDKYKQKLDNFAKALVDISNDFIEYDDGSYVYGTTAVDTSADSDKRVHIGLLTGADVKSLNFNDDVVGTLTQEKLDYLAQIQWKKDVDFDGTGQNNTSFSQYYQALRVDVANDRENTIAKKEAQGAVKESIQASYEKLTKVDKDEEMLELMKFQSAYQANAKIITAIDEMLQTLLHM